MTSSRTDACRLFSCVVSCQKSCRALREHLEDLGFLLLPCCQSLSVIWVHMSSDVCVCVCVGAFCLSCGLLQFKLPSPHSLFHCSLHPAALPQQNFLSFFHSVYFCLLPIVLRVMLFFAHTHTHRGNYLGTPSKFFMTTFTSLWEPRLEVVALATYLLSAAFIWPIKQRASSE